MILDILMTVISLIIILMSCAVFVNAVEWTGKRLNLHQGVVGSVLAAVGTALPETIIPIIAILLARGEKADEIAIGAIAGAPFMLGTLAFFLVGLAVIVCSILGLRTMKMNVDAGIYSKDLLFFVIVYGAAVMTTFVDSYTARVVIALMLLLAYLYYLKVIIKEDAETIENIEPLYIAALFKLPASLKWIAVQLLAGLVGISAGAHMFVGYVESLSLALGIAPLILSIIITPIATELPEKLNSVIWVAQSKDTLALGNITGAMVFQSCFPVLFGIMFTPWDLKGVTMVSAVLAFTSAILNLAYVKLKKTVSPFILLFGGVLYAVFLLYVFA